MQGHEGSWIKGNALWIRLASIVNIHFGYFCNLQTEGFPIDKLMNIKKTNKSYKHYNSNIQHVQYLFNHCQRILLISSWPSQNHHRIDKCKSNVLDMMAIYFQYRWIPWIYFKALTPKCPSWRQILNTTNFEWIQIWLWEPMELKRRWRESKKHIFWKLLSTSCFSPISKETCFEAVTLSTLAHLHDVQRNPIWLNACNLQLLHLWAFHQSVVLKHVTFTCREQMKNFVLDCQSFDTHFVVCTKNEKTMELVANCSSMNHQ